MTVAVKNDNKTPLVVPQAVRRRAGFKSGQELEFRASGGVITIVPRLKVPEDDEYTPAQRRLIDSRLAKADEDINAGRVYGPFETAGQMAESIEANIKHLGAVKRKSKSGR
jgi:bifunctional DNA-binding transcriptional regulator/antitoxin component of YhaV-PrlF toxin-antitoxin module